jgi:hypothetical protein
MTPVAGGVAVRIAGDARHPAFSPDGETLAYTYGRTGIAKDERVTAVTRDGGTYPRWSPAGDWIVYLGETSLRIVRPSGADARDLAPGRWLAVEWAPGGGSVTGLRMRRRMELVEIGVEDGRERVIAGLGVPSAVLAFAQAAGCEAVRGLGWGRQQGSLTLSLLRPESDLWLLDGVFARRGLLARLQR